MPGQYMPRMLHWTTWYLGMVSFPHLSFPSHPPQALNILTLSWWTEHLQWQASSTPVCQLELHAWAKKAGPIHQTGTDKHPKHPKHG